MNQKGFAPILIILGIVLLLGVAGGVYYYIQQVPKYGMGFVPSPPEVIRQRQTSTPSSTIDETANWKTYTNKRVGFEIKYPPDVDIGTQLGMGMGPVNENEGKFLAFIFPYVAPGAHSKYGDEGNIEINIIQFSGTVKEFVNSGQTQELRRDFSSSDQPQKETINGLDMLFYDQNTSAPFPTHLAVFVGKGFAFEYYLTDTAKTLQEVPLKILSTFKFLP